MVGLPDINWMQQLGEALQDKLLNLSSFLDENASQIGDELLPCLLSAKC